MYVSVASEGVSVNASEIRDLSLGLDFLLFAHCVLVGTACGFAGVLTFTGLAYGHGHAYGIELDG